MAQGGQFQEPVSETYLVNLLEKISDNKGESKIKVLNIIDMFINSQCVVC